MPAPSGAARLSSEFVPPPPPAGRSRSRGGRGNRRRWRPALASRGRRTPVRRAGSRQRAAPIRAMPVSGASSAAACTSGGTPTPPPASITSPAAAAARSNPCPSGPSNSNSVPSAKPARARVPGPTARDRNTQRSSAAARKLNGRGRNTAAPGTRNWANWPALARRPISRVATVSRLCPGATTRLASTRQRSRTGATAGVAARRAATGPGAPRCATPLRARRRCRLPRRARRPWW